MCVILKLLLKLCFSFTLRVLGIVKMSCRQKVLHSDEQRSYRSIDCKTETLCHHRYSEKAAEFPVFPSDFSAPSV